MSTKQNDRCHFTKNPLERKNFIRANVQAVLKSCHCKNSLLQSLILVVWLNNISPSLLQRLWLRHRVFLGEKIESTASVILTKKMITYCPLNSETGFCFIPKVRLCRCWWHRAGHITSHLRWKLPFFIIFLSLDPLKNNVKLHNAWKSFIKESLFRCCLVVTGLAFSCYLNCCCTCTVVISSLNTRFKLKYSEC